MSFCLSSIVSDLQSCSSEELCPRRLDFLVSIWKEVHGWDSKNGLRTSYDHNLCGVNYCKRCRYFLVKRWEFLKIKVSMGKSVLSLLPINKLDRFIIFKLFWLFWPFFVFNFYFTHQHSHFQIAIWFNNYNFWQKLKNKTALLVSTLSFCHISLSFQKARSFHFGLKSNKQACYEAVVRHH